MALYLSRWFALLAWLGVQGALLFTAWLLGSHRARRTQIILVHSITALVSVAFSYVSLYTWFAQSERPALVQRQLFDRLSETAQQADETLTAAGGEARKHVIALEEITEAEKRVGFLAKAVDADPYLGKVREAVTQEAQGREGSGEGARYSAFARSARLAQQTQAQIDAARQGLVQWRSRAKPTDASSEQLRSFHAAYDGIPWAKVTATLHSGTIARPAVPSLTGFVDQTGSGQEDLMLAFTELFSAPTGRNVFSLALAAFIDVIIILIALVSSGASRNRGGRAGRRLWIRWTRRYSRGTCCGRCEWHRVGWRGFQSKG